jgi:GntR family transcriptional regulator
MFVAEGAREAALSSERRRFLNEEWPALKRRIELLELSPKELLSGDTR